MKHSACYRFLLVMMVMSFGQIYQPAAGQSDSELRRENQRLNTLVQETNRELEAARARIVELEEQVRRLERALAITRGDSPPPTQPAEEKVTIDESEPDASPRALFRALQQDYQEAMQSMELGRPGDRERTNYMRALRQWRAGVIRKYRSPVQWHVRVERAVATRVGFDLTLEAVDPITHVKLGEAFEVSLPRGLARRYENLRETDDVEFMVLRGTLVPNVNINPDRQESGPFDNPRLIGPFAEFQFTIEPRSLLAADDVEDDARR